MSVFVADRSENDWVAVIEVHEEGAYLLLFDRADLTRPRIDMLHDDLGMAKLAAKLDHGIPENMWVEDHERAKLM